MIFNGFRAGFYFNFNGIGVLISIARVLNVGAGSLAGAEAMRVCQ